MSKERFLTLLQSKYVLPLTFSLLGLILIFIGIGSMVFSDNNKQGVLIEQAASTENASSSGVTKQIFVDVSGAVEHPGVYSLSLGSRIQEALIAAGGFAINADREYISKNINLAAKISDGGKVYVPAKGESITRSASSGQAGSVAGVVSGLVNINSASQSELEALPGIGPVTATKIIENRPYSEVNDLLSKKVVGQSVFGKIKEKIAVY